MESAYLCLLSALACGVVHWLCTRVERLQMSLRAPTLYKGPKARPGHGVGTIASGNGGMIKNGRSPRGSPWTPAQKKDGWTQPG